MTRFATLTVSALTALGVLLSPAPATAADGDDIAGILAGVLAVGIIAKAIDDRKDRKKAQTVVEPRRTTEYGRLRSLDDEGYIRRGNRVIRGSVSPWMDGGKGPKAGRGYKKQPLPASCLRRLETARHDRQVYAARCLNRNYKFANRLPRACAFNVETRRGLRTVYGARCLKRDGWRTARR